MKAFDVAMKMGLTIKQFEDHSNAFTDVVEAEHFVAALKGNEVHLAIELKGLGGRRVLRECRDVLRRWLDLEPVLVAPVKHGNIKAIRIAEALGFRKYGETSVHAWLSLTRERVYVS